MTLLLQTIPTIPQMPELSAPRVVRPSDISVVMGMPMLCMVVAVTTILNAEQSDVPPEKRDWHAYIQKGHGNAGMQQQARKAMDLLDLRIGRVIQSISVKYDSKAKELLSQSQATWERYAKAKCHFLSDSYRGGTHSGLAYGYAYIKEQIDRIDELRQMHKYRVTP